MKKHFLLYVVLAAISLLHPAGEAKAGWNNFIVNFDKNLYGKGSQTWQIAPYDEKWVYFANKNGMVQFDGDGWNIFPLNNGSEVRSILTSSTQNRIYVGGINEFGYFVPGENGSLDYHCLSDSLENDVRLIGNVWGIHESDNILYFQGDGTVVKYLNGKYTAIPIDAKIDVCNTVNNILYIGTDRGVWLLVGNTFFPLQGAQDLASKRIRAILPYKKGVLVVTAYNGLYYCDGHTMVPYVTGAEGFLRENEVFCASIKMAKIALGTIHKGLLLIDTNTHQIKYFNENNGLRNNTVLSVSFDSIGNLWAGLDSGIDYVCLSSPFTNLYSYPYSYGTGYAAAVEGEYLYLGTNRGLFYTPYPVRMNGSLPDIRPIPQSSGQVWNICRIGDELFCLHDCGMFKINGTSVERVTDITGVWFCQLVEGTTDEMFVGVYNGIYLLVKRDGKWQMLRKLEGLNDSSRIFEQESPTVLWIYNTDHFTRVELDAKLTKALSITNFDAESGAPTGRDMNMAKVDGRVYFSTPRGIFKYNYYKSEFEPCPELNNILNGATEYSNMFVYHDKLITISSHEVCIANLQSYKRGANTSINPVQQSMIELVPSYETIIPISDSLMVIPNEDGFALFSIPEDRNRIDRSNSLSIKNMYLSYPKDSLVYTANFLGNKTNPVIAYSFNSVRFEYAVPFLTSDDDIRYQYHLDDDKWSEHTTLNTKEYSNLHEGEHSFEVRAIFPDGTTSIDRIDFRILAPWYRCRFAYICYLVLILLLMWFLHLFGAMHIKRKKQQAIAEKDIELKEMQKEFKEEKIRQEKHIMELENEKLEYDLKHKSQEVANLMINFTRKNEMLTEIKTEIQKVVTQLKGEGARDGKQQLMQINSKIDSNIQSDEVLKRIEDQFDLIHNNFMKRLHEKHPDLTNNERMMCAYLKMNLSSKEIAPLLNISVRGVETIRYRLRKKMSLSREDNLIEYLNERL